jgi:tRNA1(Val) A37 N6-methylase TrmN6
MNPDECDAKQIGSYYTPSWLAKWITNHSLNYWFNHNSQLLKQVCEIKIVDPAVGDGVFLLTAADWLLMKRKALGDMKLDEEIRKEIVSNSLYGVDIAKQAAIDCEKNLHSWAGAKAGMNVKVGNSISGEFQWEREFDDVFRHGNPGFDLVLGNPPYGNLLSQEDKLAVQQALSHDISTGRKGTWNTAALFMVKARELLKQGGYLGFLVPNSILRVGQFSKLRRFLLDHFNILEIADEASPFKGVTLEMVSIIAKAGANPNSRFFSTVSRRSGLQGTGEVPLEICQVSRVFPLYYDDIFERALAKGKREMLTASRGRDIPKNHTRSAPSNGFEIPYATSGRSVKRYRLDENFMIYTDDWYRDDLALTESFETEILLATKNYPYPRCVMKPRGVIHGGGAVRISPLERNLDMRAAGLVLNSRFIRYLCIRYLTNYSQLTTCLNTGIMEDLPLALPEDTVAFSTLFESLSLLNEKQNRVGTGEELSYLESVADALVYELYLDDSGVLLKSVNDALKTFKGKHVFDRLYHPDIRSQVRHVFADKDVQRIEASPRM